MPMNGTGAVCLDGVFQWHQASAREAVAEFCTQGGMRGFRRVAAA